MTYYKGSPVQRNFGAPLTIYNGNCEGTDRITDEQWFVYMRETETHGAIRYNVSGGLRVFFWSHDRDEYIEFISKCNRALKAIQDEAREAYEEEERKRKEAEEEEEEEEKAKAARERGE